MPPANQTSFKAPKHKNTHDDLSVYSAETASDAQQTTATFPNTTLDLAQFQQSKLAALHHAFPHLGSRDVILVFGKFDSNSRQAIRILWGEVRVSPMQVILSQISAIRREHGLTDLDVFIVPEGGLSDKTPYQHGEHFSIGTNAEWDRLTSTPAHNGNRDRVLDTDKLLIALETLNVLASLPSDIFYALRCYAPVDRRNGARLGPDHRQS